MWWLVTAAISWAECPGDSLQSAVQSAGELELAYVNLDEAGFDATSARVREAIPCIRAELSSPDAFSLHRALGLVAFVEGDDSGSRKSWAAVRSLRPGWQPADSLMPSGHPLRELWDAAIPGGELVPLERAPAGGWVVDGVRTAEVPAHHAFVLQGFDADGQVIHTGYHRSLAEVPVFEPPDLSRRRRVRVVGSAGAGALLLGAAAASLVAADARNRAMDAHTPYEELPGLRTLNHVGIATGIGAGVAAVGLATVVWGGRW